MSKFQQRFWSFLRDEEGSMTIEFVIWVPWLLFYLVFTTSAYLAMDSRIEALRASVTLTDVVSRVDSAIDDEFVTDMGAMFIALTPSATEERLVRISAITFAAGDYVVNWSICMGGVTPLLANDLVDNPNLAAAIPRMAELSTILLVETYIPYTPVSEVFGLEPVIWANRKAVTPRWELSPALDANLNITGCGTKTVD